jgi:hypothetical protein
MKIKDFCWLLGIVLFTLFVVLPNTHQLFVKWTLEAPYIMGFIKTAYLATMGEMLVNRIKSKKYLSIGIHLKAVLWGVFGIIFVFIFKIFAEGVVVAQSQGFLPIIVEGRLSVIWTAFLISLIMNLFFAPSFMLLHRISDQFIELGEGKLKNIKSISIYQVVDHIDFKTFISFVLFKTIPFFWIPAHTITFILPEQYRVLMAAYLSIALGIILTVSKQMKIGHIRTV